MIRRKAPIIPPDDTTVRGFNEEFFEQVLEALEYQPDALDSMLGNLHQADIADIIERLPREKRAGILGHIPFERVGDVISELEEGAREHVLQLLNPADLKGALDELESDDAADIARTLEEIAPDDGGEAEDYLGDHQLKRLLHYDEDTAGGLMQLEVVTAGPEQTVEQTFDFIRGHEGDMPPKPGTVFVVTPQRKLLGTVSISRLVRVPLAAKLKDVMRADPLFVLPEQGHGEVVSMFEKYDIHNLAVVNKRGQLLGRITIDDVLDVVMDESARQQARAVGLNEDADLFAPVMATSHQRLPWLMVNLLTAIAAAAVIALFEGSIAKLTILAVLMPIVTSMGGNATTQTQTVIIRALALGQITRQNAVELLKKEFLAGGYLGSLLALIMALGTWLLYDQPLLAVVIAVATVANHLFAALGGYFVPMMLKRWGYDPAISTGVLTTTITDVGGFFVFLGLATLLLL